MFNAPRASASDPVTLERSAEYLGGWLPFLFSAAIALAIMAMFFPGIPTVDDTGSTVQTISPSPTNTAVVAPMPSPTTEPRPTQAPIQ
jgi:hypothetical protein